MIDVILGISILLNVIFLVVIIFFVKKIEMLEEFFDMLQTHMRTVLDMMHSVDIRGAFETDDEVGMVFKGIKSMVDTLEEFTGRNDGSS